jgi:hypothetical protein
VEMAHVGGDMAGAGDRGDLLPKHTVAAVASLQPTARARIHAAEASCLANGPIDPETSTGRCCVLRTRGMLKP